MDAVIDDDVAEDARGSFSDRPGFLVRRLHQIYVGLFFSECAAFEITPVQSSVLRVLAVAPLLDQNSIASQIGIDRVNLADVLRRLEQRGVIERIRHPHDRRRRLARLTEEGRELYEAMVAPTLRAHEKLLAALPPEERETFMRLLRHLVEHGNAHSRADLQL